MFNADIIMGNLIKPKHFNVIWYNRIDW